MVEIVFSESACGSLKVAQHFEEGHYGGGCFGVVFAPSNEQPTEDEITQAQQEAEARHRQAWEEATPMGGDSRDVHGFSLGLSMGDILCEIFGPTRRRILEACLAFSPSEPGLREQLDRCIGHAEASLKTVLDRSAEGDPVRLWYSDQPDELCGFYWMLAHLDSLGNRCGPVYAVPLPRWGQRDNSVLSWTSWGEIAPEEWSRFLPLEQPVSPPLRRACTNRWRELQAENAPLRVLLNGRLVGVPENFYDPFLRRELAQMEPEFNESHFIGRVIGHCRLGIGDGLIHRRVEAMVAARELEALTQAAEGDPVYRRILRKLT